MLGAFGAPGASTGVPAAGTGAPAAGARSSLSHAPSTTGAPAAGTAAPAAGTGAAAEGTGASSASTGAAAAGTGANWPYNVSSGKIKTPLKNLGTYKGWSCVRRRTHPSPSSWATMRVPQGTDIATALGGGVASIDFTPRGRRPAVSARRMELSSRKLFHGPLGSCGASAADATAAGAASGVAVGAEATSGAAVGAEATSGAVRAPSEPVFVSGVLTNKKEGGFSPGFFYFVIPRSDGF